MTKRSGVHRIHELEEKVAGLEASKGLLQDVIAALCRRDTGKVIVTLKELQEVERDCGGIQWTETKRGEEPAIMFETVRKETAAFAAGPTPPPGEPS